LRQLSLPIVALALLVAAALPLSACSRDPGSSLGGCTCQDAQPLVDPALVAYLSRARAAHHVADEQENQGNLSAAALALDRLVAALRPARTGAYAEVNEVLADTHARLADLRSRLGEFDSAIRHVQLGLRRAKSPTYFRGHLFEVLGLVNERQSAAFKAKGNVAQAEASRQRALDAFEQAMKIQDAVIVDAVKKRERQE
jgi:tetratricopeptide (TPR) repeat protein